MGKYMIEIDNVTKKYKLGQIGGTTLREELQRRRARRLGKEDPTKKIGAKDYKDGEEFWALSEVSFHVNKGERVGIIGHNGAGKSTLLKLISRVTAPTTGEIGLDGRVTSMLEVGTGFNGELTGRENIYMNGAILGMTKKEIDAKIDDIIAFSECGQFIDTPVKRYSSGMYVKLAFSVAAHLDSEIMIMDEVLAVGDMAFQKKCLAKMNEVSRNEGRTILYVSHNMSTIRNLCNRCVVLDHGKVVFDGEVEEGIRLYMNQGVDSDQPYTVLTNRERPVYSHNDVRMDYIRMLGKDDIVFTHGEKISFELGWTSFVDAQDVRMQLILGYHGEGVGSSFSSPFVNAKKGEVYTTCFEYDTAILAEGEYNLTISLCLCDPIRGAQYHLDFVSKVCSFVIQRNNEDQQYIEWYHPGWGSVRFPDFIVHC